MNETDPTIAPVPAPTAARPLLGLTVLVVEDSRFACEAMRVLCLRSGARIRRADCLRSARRHLQVYRPTVAIVDLGLPDGNGIDLIAEMAYGQPRVEALIATSGDLYLEAEAFAAGADNFLPKPVRSLASFQSLVLAALPKDRQPPSPRQIPDEIIHPDRIAFQDDMVHIAEVLEDQPNDHALDYVTQFLSGVARSAGDTGLEQAASALARKRAAGEPTGSEAAALAGLIQTRLDQRIAI